MSLSIFSRQLIESGGSEGPFFSHKFDICAGIHDTRSSASLHLSVAPQLVQCVGAGQRCGLFRLDGAMSDDNADCVVNSATVRNADEVNDSFRPSYLHPILTS
jgi:hypothetical protein